MSSILFLDLETCQAQDKNIINDVISNMKPPANYKKQEVIDKWLADNKENAVSKTSFSGLQGEIICIGYAVNDGQVMADYRLHNGNSERDLLVGFFSNLVSNYGPNFNPRWAGHNICEFDLRFLFHRCVINNVKPLIDIPYNDKPWSNFVYDTLYETMGNNKAGGSLDRIARAFGLEGKLSGMDGSKINQMWLDGDIAKISDYCKNDVEVTRNIYKRLMFIDKIEG